jgi:molybdopterin molybdotransferase
LIITSGGMAGSEEDHTRTALEEAGGTWRLGSVRMKPGKPAGVGVIGNTAVLSLPGNPFAAFAALAVIGVPLMAALAGTRDRLHWQPASSGFTLDRSAVGPRSSRRS